MKAKLVEVKMQTEIEIIVGPACIVGLGKQATEL